MLRCTTLSDYPMLHVTIQLSAAQSYDMYVHYETQMHMSTY